MIFLVLEPYKRIPLVKFHAYQCIGLTVVSIAISIVRHVMFAATLGVGGLGTFGLFALVFGLLHLVLFVLWLIGIISAAQGKWFKIPIIGDFALKQSQMP